VETLLKLAGEPRLTPVLRADVDRALARILSALFSRLPLLLSPASPAPLVEVPAPAQPQPPPAASVLPAARKSVAPSPAIDAVADGAPPPGAAGEEEGKGGAGKGKVPETVPGAGAEGKPKKEGGELEEAKEESSEEDEEDEEDDDEEEEEESASASGWAVGGPSWTGTVRLRA
jgi:hypothetical protein